MQGVDQGPPRPLHKSPSIRAPMPALVRCTGKHEDLVDPSAARRGGESDVAHPDEVAVDECDEGVGLGRRDERHVVARGAPRARVASAEVARAADTSPASDLQAPPGSRGSGRARRRPSGGVRSRRPPRPPPSPPHGHPGRPRGSILTKSASLRMASSPPRRARRASIQWAALAHSAVSPVLPETGRHRQTEVRAIAGRPGSAAMRRGCCPLRDPAHRAMRAEMRRQVCARSNSVEPAEARVERTVRVPGDRLLDPLHGAEAARTRAWSRGVDSAPFLTCPRGRRMSAQRDWSGRPAHERRRCARLAHPLGRLEAERAGEHRQAPEHSLDHRDPADRDSTRWWLRASGGAGGRFCCHRQASWKRSLQALDQLLEAEGPESHGRQLDCEGDTVQAPRQLDHDGLVVGGDLEGGARFSRALDE